MNEPDRWNAMVEAVRYEPSPSIDVVDRVMTSIAATPQVDSPDRPLAWAAGIAVAAALLVAVQTGLLSGGLNDPLADWLGSLTVVMQ
jgi:hypothetical protein